jgi:hypothetical protein
MLNPNILGNQSIFLEEVAKGKKSFPSPLYYNGYGILSMDNPL